VLVTAACTQEQPVQEVATVPSGMRPDIVATNAFYYYGDVEAAWVFYRDTLGLETVIDYGFAKIMRLADSSYLTLVDAAEGMHSADEPKIVTLHLVTDQLNRWHTHFLRLGMPIEYDGASLQGGMPDSFIVQDAEGYALRFVRYNPQPNQVSFVDSFAYAPPVPSTAGSTTRKRYDPFSKHCSMSSRSVCSMARRSISWPAVASSRSRTTTGQRCAHPAKTA
jgi:hypothetical protein